MTERRYPQRALRGDYLRAGTGLVLTLLPAAAVGPHSAALYILLPAAALFLAFGWRTWNRQRTRVVVDSEGISLFSPQRVSLPWKNIQSVRLSYYSLKSDRTGGWMQLTLRGVDPQENGARRAIRVDSALEGFDGLARQVAAAVALHDIDVSDVSRANFGSLGVVLADVAPGR